MAGEEKVLVAGLVGLGIGVIVGAALANNTAERRAEFSRSLGSHLEGSGIHMLACDLGRGPQGAVWVLTLQLPNQHVLTLHAPVGSAPDPFDAAQSADVAGRVMRYVAENAA